MADDLVSKFLLGQAKQTPVQKGPVQGPPKPGSAADVAGKIAPKLTQKEQIAANKKREVAKAKKSWQKVRVGNAVYEYEFTGYETMTPEQKLAAKNAARADIIKNDPGAKKAAASTANPYAPAEAPVTETGAMLGMVKDAAVKVGNKALDMMPIVQSNKAAASVAGAMGLPDKYRELAKALNVQVPDAPVVNGYPLYDKQGVQLAADLTINNVSGAVSSAANALDPKLDNIGRTQGALETAANVLPLVAPIKAGVDAYKVAKGTGKPIAKAVAQGIGTAAAESAGMRPEHQELAKKLGLNNPVEQAVKVEYRPKVSGFQPAEDPSYPKSFSSIQVNLGSEKPVWAMSQSEFMSDARTFSGKTRPMTLNEWRSANNRYVPLSDQGMMKYPHGISKAEQRRIDARYAKNLDDLSKSAQEYKQLLSEGKIPDVQPGGWIKADGLDLPSQEAAARVFHKREVLKALKEGKPVPQSVIDSIPALKGMKGGVASEWSNPAFEIKPATDLPYMASKPKPVQQPVQVPEGTPATSARKAMVAEDRANMGLGELEAPLRKTWGEALDNARNRGFNDAWAEREAKSVIEKPRAFSDEETAGMTEAMARRKVEFKSVRNQLATATDPAEIEKLSNDLAGIQKQYDTLSEAVGLSGTEKGRALASQKLTINDDFDLISIKSEAKASKKADLTDKENAMFDDMVKRLEVAEARIAEVEMKNLDLQAMVDSMPKGAKSGRRIARTSVEIKAARADALERIKASKPTAMYSGLAPLGDIDYKAIAQYALTFVEEGVGKVEDVINLTLKGAKEAGIDLSEQEVKKALIDWGTPKKSTRELDAAIFQRDRLRKEIRQSIADLGESTFERIRKEATALPRALQATGDLSATLRQGLILGAGNKRKALAAFGKAMKAVVDPVYSAKLERELMSSPMAVVRKQAKLYIADGETMSLAEEAFMSRIAKEYPILKTISGASERHYTTFLNQLRASVFDDMVARFPEMTMQDKTALADFINVATGRGRVAHGLSEKASKVFFSPRFMASRIEAPLDAVGLTKEGRAMWKSPGARHQLMKSWSTLIAGGGTLLGLAKLAGGEVSLDPDSPDFGKARFGDTSFDIWGGMQSPVRLLAKIAKQAKSGDKPAYNKGSAQEVMKFLRYKLAPAPNIAIGLFDKQDAVGQPYTVDKTGKMTPMTVGEDLAKSFSPLLIKDLASLWNLDGETNTPIGAKVAGTVAAPLGVGVSTYKRKN